MYLACQIYAVGCSTSKIFVVDLTNGGGVRWTSFFADNEDGSPSDDNTEPMFTIGALDEAVLAARNGTDQVKINARPEAVGEVDLLRVFQDWHVSVAPDTSQCTVAESVQIEPHTLREPCEVSNLGRSPRRCLRDRIQMFKCCTTYIYIHNTLYRD